MKPCLMRLWLLGALAAGGMACSSEEPAAGFNPQTGAGSPAPNVAPDPTAGPSTTPTGVTPSAPNGQNTPPQPGGDGPTPTNPSTTNTPTAMSDAGMPSPVTDVDAGEPIVDKPRPPCMKNPSQVVLLGDSYMNWVSHTFPQDMARNFGNGTTGVWDVPYTQGGRLYAIGAWAMGSGGIGLIPDQLGFAIDDDPDMIAAIMTGGGNDVLVPGAEWVGGGDCKNSDALPPLDVCQQIVAKAFEASRNLMMRAADAGVRDVVYFFYPEVPAPTLVGGTSPNTVLGWTYPMVEELCANTETMTEGRLRCHFLDTRPIFKGHADYFAPTDIHPNAMGSDALTKAIAELMNDRCIAQPESSGCCEP